MKKSDFFYDLPQELIAQHPAEPRDSSRLMVLDKKTGAVKHDIFHNIAQYIEPGDCLILNDTKVLPARLYGTRVDTGSVVEFLLLNNKGDDIWEVITGPGKKARKGHRFTFHDMLFAEIVDVLPDGNRLAKFTYDGVFFELLDKIGEMPLPHYITEKLENNDRYQTVYARERGSAAAPTAGLHARKGCRCRIRHPPCRSRNIPTRQGGECRGSPYALRALYAAGGYGETHKRYEEKRRTCFCRGNYLLPHARKRRD